MINPFQMHTAFAKHTKLNWCEFKYQGGNGKKEQPAKNDKKILADMPYSVAAGVVIVVDNE